MDYMNSLENRSNAHDELYMLWLSTYVTRLGSRKLNALLEHFGSAKEIFTADAEALRAAGGLTPVTLDIMTRNRTLDAIEAMLRGMEAQQIAYFSRNHE